MLVGGLVGSSVGGDRVTPYGATPSPRHLAWHDREFYAFVHFNMNTFTGVEWGHGGESPEAFNPTALDCRQWCALFKECGMTGVILTVKHHDGFCLWDSRFTEHDVASSPWRGGRGDVLRELADACEETGLWLGVYISPWDRNNPIYGRDDAAYNDYFVGQLEELLGGAYGPIAEVWWDGANGDRGNPEKHQEYDWPRYIETVRRLQPEAVIFAPPYTPGDIRWVGNEIGVAGETQWATYPAGGSEDRAALNVGVPGAPDWMPAETDVSIRPGWYWSEETDGRVKSLEELLDIYYASVGRNTNLLLNLPVDRRGLVHEADAAGLRGLGAVLRTTYEFDLAFDATATSPLSAPRHAATSVNDGEPTTFWAAPAGETTGDVELAFDERTRFDRVVLQEPIEVGQRVEAWRLEARVAGEWREIARGTTIGHKRIARFDAVDAGALRLRVLASRARPLIERIGVYKAPPSVRIEPAEGAFVDRLTVRLTPTDPDAAIGYTLDGSAPTGESPRYGGPFEITEGCIVRAVAIGDDGAPSPLTARRSYEAFSSDRFRAAERTATTAAGLRVERFEGGWQTLDQMPRRTPVEVGVCAAIDAGERSRDDNAALRFTGYADAPRDGVYEFRLTSDDGSRLWIGDRMLIDHDGLHGMQTKTVRIALRAGKHSIRVEWFNVGAGLGLNLEWSGPGFDRQPIPAERLSHDPRGVSRHATEFRGWRDAVEIVNDRVRVVVVPSVGRVMHYSLRGEPNLLHVDESLAGVTLEGGAPRTVDGVPIWSPFGGARVWPTEEHLFKPVNGAKRPPDFDIDGSPWLSEPVAGGVATESRVSRSCGARIRREVTLTPGSSVVTIHQTMTKVAAEEPPALRPLPMTIWSISKVHRPDALLFPVGRKSGPFPGGVFTPVWDDAPNRAADLVRVADDVAVLKPAGPGTDQKAGADAPGWVAAVLGDRAMGEFFAFDPAVEYPDGGTSATAYLGGEIGELECLSPLRRLKPGESIEHTIHWNIAPLSTATLDDRVAETAAWARTAAKEFQTRD